MANTKGVSTQGSGHGGNIHLLSRQASKQSPIIDFSANINPLGPPAWLRPTISRELSGIMHYPDPDCYDFINAAAEFLEIPGDTIVAANGTTELLYALPGVLQCARAVIPVPSYIDYQKVMEMNGVEVIRFPLSPEDNFRLDIGVLADIILDNDIVIIGSPNNPTAAVVEHSSIVELAGKFPNAWFLIDEAFLDFVEQGRSVAGLCGNIITLNSLTKFYAIPGLRLGFGTFPAVVAEKIRHRLPPWTVNTLAQAIGVKLFADVRYKKESLHYLHTVRTGLLHKLSALQGITVFPSEVNYFLLRIDTQSNAHALAEHLLQHNIAVRVCDNYTGLNDKYFRIAVRTEEENNKLIDGLEAFFSQTRQKPGKRKRRHHPALMIQGTSSNAGKSVLVTALCRILIQDGVRVAPFKAQNMSLNSFVTHDGLEMGRAQVVQAQAAKLDPDVRMNPVLLKPNSDIGSQIIVDGKPVGNMSVAQYVRYKDEAGRRACRSYDSLASEYDAILLEGAGSPGEVNLKHHDIVNMQMARYAQAPVLLVGDIDRGGVYASFVGTMEVLEEWERRLVSGFLVNRFRGDASLLAPAHRYLLDHTGKPVLGTIPYIRDLNIPEEDSVSFKEGKLQKIRPRGEHVEIALVNLPHISNFTDIEPFLEEPDIFLKIIDSVEDLGEPLAIIIPGSKNVMGDLEYLNSSGMGKAIIERAAKGCEIVGICGGYQILGKSIADPHSIESDNGTGQGLGLLDITTSLAEEKTLIRRKGKHIGSGIAVHGYEIHHGISNGQASPLLQFDDQSTCGNTHGESAIWGAYLHGIFDSDPFRRWFIDNLREKAGLGRLERIVAPYNLETAFDNLAQVVRNSIDMDSVYRLLDL
jgi:cobyric acid synthase CobQ/L-threonine-O-3-phosphate decarboxylase